MTALIEPFFFFFLFVCLFVCLFFLCECFCLGNYKRIVRNTSCDYHDCLLAQVSFKVQPTRHTSGLRAHSAAITKRKLHLCFERGKCFALFNFFIHPK